MKSKIDKKKYCPKSIQETLTTQNIPHTPNFHSIIIILSSPLTQFLTPKYLFLLFFHAWMDFPVTFFVSFRTGNSSTSYWR